MLVFGQPPHQNIFPGASRSDVMEEYIEDILREGEEEKENPEEDDKQEKEQNDSNKDCNEDEGENTLLTHITDPPSSGDKDTNKLPTKKKTRQHRKRMRKVRMKGSGYQNCF